MLVAARFMRHHSNIGDALAIVAQDIYKSNAHHMTSAKLDFSSTMPANEASLMDKISSPLAQEDKMENTIKSFSVTKDDDNIKTDKFAQALMNGADKVKNMKATIKNAPLSRSVSASMNSAIVVGSTSTFRKKMLPNVISHYNYFRTAAAKNQFKTLLSNRLNQSSITQEIYNHVYSRQNIAKMMNKTWFFGIIIWKIIKSANKTTKALENANKV